MEEKTAWFNLWTSVGALLAFAILGFKYGFVVGMAGLCLTGLYGVPAILYRRDRDFDERDLLINRKATITGAMFSYMVVILLAMGAWAGCMSKGLSRIDVNFLPLIVAIMAMTFVIMRSIMLIRHYRTS